MKAAIITAAGTPPTFGDFPAPVAREGLELITVTAAALSNLTRGRAAGSHYSSDNHYPFVPGVDGVGTTTNGRRVYFVMPEAPLEPWRNTPSWTRAAPYPSPQASTT